MRTLTNRSAFYAPEPTPEVTTIEALTLYVMEELKKISNTVVAITDLNLAATHIAPLRPREGDTRLADGVNWNPGAGKGVYTYYSSGWNKLG